MGRIGRIAVTLIAVAVSISTGAAAIAVAGIGEGDGGEPMGGGPGGPLMRLAQVLDLDEPQRDQIRELRMSEMDQIQPLLQQLAEVDAELRQVAEAETLDEVAVRNLALARADLMVELMVSQVRTQFQIDALLTPEQLELARKLRFPPPPIKPWLPGPPPL